MKLYTKQGSKYRQLCRERVIYLLNRWHHDAEGWLLLATLDEQDETLKKLCELLTEDVAALGWNEMLKHFGI